MNTIVTQSRVLLLLLAACCSLTTASATILTDFSGGNGTSNANQYPGTSGNGWAGAWSAVTAGGSGIAINPTVINTDPFPGQPANTNYLSVPITRTNASNRQASIFRSYENGEGITLTSDHQIEIVFRINSVSTLSATNTFFTIADTSAVLTDRIAPTTAPMAWGIFSLGGGSYTTQELMFKGVDLDTHQQVYSQTGILLQDDTVYKLNIAIDAINKTYTGTIADLTHNASFSVTLGFADSQTQVSGRLAFIQSDGDQNGMNYDVQSITIVPEASTMAYLLPSAFVLYVLIKKRRRSC